MEAEANQPRLALEPKIWLFLRRRGYGTAEAIAQWCSNGAAPIPSHFSDLSGRPAAVSGTAPKAKP